MTDWKHDEPFQQLPLLPPKRDIETHAVLKSCIKARSSLAELKQAVELLPNPAILINTLPLLEAKASSEIENIVTTTDKLFRSLKNDQNADPATKEALRYSRALFEGFKKLRSHPLNTRTAEHVCSIIKGVEMRVRQVPGTALAREATNEVVYTPPVGEQVLRDKLANWEQYLHENEETDPLVKMAVGHYQFEAIHPFTDGNGRTGRVINSLYLIDQNLLTLPVLYLSRHILHHRSKYNELLLSVTRAGEWEEWILFMLEAVEKTAEWTRAKIKAIRDLAKHTREFVQESLPKIYSFELIDTLFELPYCRISNIVEKEIVKRQTASIYLKDLARIGVLFEVAETKEKLYGHTKLMKLLSEDNNEFAKYF